MGVLTIIAKRVAIIGLSAGAIASFNYAQLSYQRVSDPIVAQTAHPDDAWALAAKLAAKVENDPEFTLDARELEHLRAALLERPLDANLIAFWALTLDQEGQPDKAAKAMAVADRVSKRSALSQLWLIEHASASGKVREALEHYHAALSTHPDLRPFLLPVLASAISFGEVREGLGPYITMKANWIDSFLKIAVAKSDTASLFAFLETHGAQLRDPQQREMLASFLHKMANEGNQIGTRKLMVMLNPGLNSAVFHDLSVSEQSLNPALGRFAWTFPNRDGIFTEAKDGQGLAISVDPLAQGTAATRDFMVKEGEKYSLVQRVQFDTEPSKPALKWMASCVKSGVTETFWDQKIPFSNSTVTYNTKVIVPVGCHVIRLSVHASGSESQFPSSVTVDRLELRRL